MTIVAPCSAKLASRFSESKGDRESATTHAAPANAIDIAAMTAAPQMVETSNGRSSAPSGANRVDQVCEKLTGGCYRLAPISLVPHLDCDQ